MTTRDHARRGLADARSGRLGADRDEPYAGGPGLPDRLAAARERKGVDLMRAERDTKIRVRYLSALERGDYRELPGAVYTKGFLRNYAIYLGLDPEDVLRQWRRERGDQATPEPQVVPLRPIAEPARPLTFSPSIIVAALLTFVVVAFGVYVSFQLLRYAKPPDLTVTDPSPASISVDESVTSYHLTGTASPGSTISVSAPGLDQPYRVTAAPDGSWSVDVGLRHGKNQFDIGATNPDTGKQADTPHTVVINVPFLAIQTPTLTVSQPVDGTNYANGAIPVEGTTTNAKTITVAAAYLGAAGTPAGAAASPAPKPAPTPRPATATVTVGDDGSFSTPLELTQGRWAITITATSDEGKTASLTRKVTVAYKGVTLVVSINGGPAWLKVWVDGNLAPSIPQSGVVFANGKVLTFSGSHSVEVRTGSSGNTYFTLNGVSLGALGKPGIPETWLFAPPNAPTKTNRF